MRKTYSAWISCSNRSSSRIFSFIPRNFNKVEVWSNGFWLETLAKKMTVGTFNLIYLAATLSDISPNKHQVTSFISLMKALRDRNTLYSWMWLIDLVSKQSFPVKLSSIVPVEPWSQQQSSTAPRKHSSPAPSSGCQILL